MNTAPGLSLPLPASPASPSTKPLLSPDRQKLADAIQHLADAEADLAGLLVADRRALDMAADAREAVARADAMMAEATTLRTANTVRALSSSSGRLADGVQNATSATRAAHAAAIEALALAVGVRDAVAADLDRLRTFTVPSREGFVASAIQDVAEEVEHRFEALARQQRESWSTIRDNITAYKRALRNNPDAVPPL